MLLFVVATVAIVVVAASILYEIPAVVFNSLLSFPVRKNQYQSTVSNHHRVPYKIAVVVVAATIVLLLLLLLVSALLLLVLLLLLLLRRTAILS